jgi:MFS family permease
MFPKSSSVRVSCGFLLSLVVVSWIITFFDGFDTNLISFAAPYFASGYHLSRVQLGNIFAMGLLGTLIGGFVLGYVGDRIGRRPTVILATAGDCAVRCSAAQAWAGRRIWGCSRWMASAWR